MNESSFQDSEHSFFGDENYNIDSERSKNQIDYSKNSSNPECVFDKINKEIKYVIENGKDLSYSNSNSKISDQYQNKEQFLYSRFWRVKNNNNENDSSKLMMNNILYDKLHKNNIKDNSIKSDNDNEENILYYNKEFEETKSNDDFDEEDMQEQTIENKEKGINEINSIKVNKNNLNNKDNLTSFEPNININSDDKEPKDKNIHNDKINKSNTPNKINQLFVPPLYNTNKVHSFISTYNNYPSNLSKGSFISTNNSSNNKIKKNEDHCPSEIEEDFKLNNFNNQNINNYELKATNDNIYSHGNKFGPHLMDYSHLQNTNLSNINMDQNNLVNLNGINNINNFNLNNNFLYRGIPKMNLNMAYYLPIQQQAISTNNVYINGNKILPNLNSSNNDNSIKNGNLKNSNKENNKINKNINNSNNSSINEKKEKEKSNSKEKKSKNKINNNNSINSNNNFKNKNNDNHNSNINSNNNNNNNHKNLLNLDDIVSGKDTRTTVMIRNIPIKYTDTKLVEELSEFKGKYDCLYMPYDYEKKGNKGYAFINFTNPLHILYFHEKFYGKKWPLFESPKICELNSANFQGISEIQKHSKNYKGLRKPLFYDEQNNNNVNENIVIPSKYLKKLKLRFPKMKFHENKVKKLITIDSFE
jgi:hypothetical protein